MFGYQLEELIGEDIQKIIPAEANQRWLVRQGDCAEDENENNSAVGGDFLVEKKTGEVFPVEIGSSSAPSLEGELNISAVIDLTARIQLENELLQRNEEISRNQALNKVGRMANMIAHDLRNPLSSIKMGLQITQKQAPNMTVENALEINQIALDQVQYMEEILADLMSYSRPDALNLEWVDVTKVIEHSISLVQKEVEMTDATINTWYEKGLPLISVDARKLRQVISNLLANAIQSVEMLDGIAPVINISVQLNHGEDCPGIKIIVEDNGCGIDIDSVEELFEPFYTKRARGTGLGLAIARRFVELQQGKLQLEASEKTGCSAIVRLKIDPAQLTG
jgi:PAS domain S-box-containing protein